MKKTHVIGLALALVVGAGVWWWSDQSRREIEDLKRMAAEPLLNLQEKEPAPPPQQEGPPRLAIGPLGLGSAQQNANLADLTLAELTAVEGLELVGRRELDRALREAGLTLAGLTTSEEAVTAGRLARANLFLLGTSTTSGTDPAALVRLVDTDTGIIRDLTLLLRPAGDLPGSASAVAGFVREVLTETNATKRACLALGSFQDLSANNRQGSFPSRLVPYLQQAYQGSGVTLLEREAVNTLLQESRLALGGLTDDQTPPPPMRTAVWLVSGVYQALENGSNQVDLIVQVERVRGGRFSTSLRGAADTNLFAQVKEAIDASIEKGRDFVFPPNRRAEIAAHMEKGGRLSGMETDALVSSKWGRASGGFFGFNTDEFSESAVQDLRDAIREFETVLLLDPDNLDARRRLACCLIDQRINEPERARDCLREIIAIAQDTPRGWGARIWLAESYLGRDDRQALEMARGYLSQPGGTNWTVGFEQTETRALEKLFQQGEIGREEYAPVVERSIFAALRAEHERLLKLDKDLSTGALNRLSRLYGWNSPEAAAAFERLLPRMEAGFPALKPFLIARAVGFQIETNAPAITRFSENLASNLEHPDEVKDAPTYFGGTILEPFHWAQKHQHYDLMFQIQEAREAAAAKGIVPAPEDEFYVRIAFAHAARKDYASALKLLEPIEDRTVKMTSDGPWGSFQKPFPPANAAAYCRAQLGLAAPADSRHFSLGKIGFVRKHPFAFACDGDNIVAAGGVSLISVSGEDLQFIERVDLPLPDLSADYRLVNCLAPSEDTAWVGTAGEGLLEVNRRTQEVRRWTAEHNGLTMDYVSALHVTDNRLWIGYAHENVGGLSVMDLTTKKVRGFTPPLRTDVRPDRGFSRVADLDVANGPPRKPVRAIASRGATEIWLGVFEKGVQRLVIAGEIWGTSPVLDVMNSVSCIAVDEKRVAAGSVEARSMSNFIRGGLSIFDRGSDERRDYDRTDGLPGNRVTAVALDGNHLWVGGLNFLALLDAATGEVQRQSQFSEGDVYQIIPAGRFVWANTRTNLYRIDPAKLGL